MNDLKITLMALIAIIYVQLPAAQAPSKPPKETKLPSFLSIVKKEEEKQAFKKSTEQALLKARNEFAASLPGLPANVLEIILDMLFSSNTHTYAHIKEIAQTIITLSQTNKALNAVFNNSQVILKILNAMPYTANAISLAHLLQAKPGFLPVMRSPAITQWLAQAKRKLGGGPELYNIIEQASIYFSSADKDAVAKLLKNKNIDLNWIEHGTTLLMFASMLGLTEIIELLLVAGANPEIRDRHGWTAFHYALDNLRNTFPCRKSQIRLFELLAPTQAERDQIIQYIQKAMTEEANRE